ncbi:SUMF1/EgtB/PvdO family nonheme iron enzyme [Candidatus Poribacteria bacterium]|nr:SUMF1/EgtB/PvdO family nonheme iron enzyme [Candidatus Poribacteria bacterium]
MLRGGSWNNNRNNARCANRNRNNRNNRNNNVGFRCARTWIPWLAPEPCLSRKTRVCAIQVQVSLLCWLSRANRNKKLPARAGSVCANARAGKYFIDLFG